MQLTDKGARRAERVLGGIDLYTSEHADALTRLNVALHAHALLRRDVHYIVAGRPDPPVSATPRPGGPAAALAGRPARGRRGQGGAACQRDRRDPRQHHVPAADPALPDRLRHDRHRGGGGRAAPGVLRAGDRGHPAEPALRARGRAGPAVPDGPGQGEGGRRSGDRDPRDGAAGPARHPRRGGIRAAGRPARARRAGRRGAERQERCRGGRDRRRGGRPGRDHRVHPDGRARHRHPARRQRGDSRPWSRRWAGFR